MKSDLKYDPIGNVYNQTRKADAYLSSEIYPMVKPHNGSLYQNTGRGTGIYTMALHYKGMKFIGIDPASKMLDKAKRK